MQTDLAQRVSSELHVFSAGATNELTHLRYQIISDMRTDRALPDNRDTPPGRLEVLQGQCISLFVGFKLAVPIFNVRGRFRCLEAFGMLMPETTMHKNGRVPLCKNNVGRSGQTSHIDAKSEPVAMQGLSKQYFGFCVPAPNVRHHSGSGSRVDNIRHDLGLARAQDKFELSCRAKPGTRTALKGRT